MSNTEAKIIAYSYLFNYFGGDKFNGEVITGASISLAVRIYKGDEEVKFTKDLPPIANKFYLSDVYKVSFDREKMFKVEKNLYVDNAFRLTYGWTKIDCEIVGYSFDKLVGKSSDYISDMPEEFDDMPVSEEMEVSKDDFIKFLSEHVDDFDISDNEDAQCLSYCFI